MSKITWKEKYETTLNEHASIKDIQKIFDIGQPAATNARNMAIAYCKKNGILIMNKSVPMDAVLEVTGKNREYFYKRYLEERKLAQA